MVNQSSSREFGSWLDIHSDVLRRGQSVLDLGCGLGDDARFLALSGMRTVGIDLSPARVAQAATRAPEASFAVADLRTGLPFMPGSADLVTASLSLHYFDRRTTSEIMQDIHRVLAPDGKLLCRVNVAGETLALWGAGEEIEPDFFEVEPGVFKRYFTEDTLHAALDPWFQVEFMQVDETRVFDQHVKKTLVARGRRRA